MNNSRFKRLNPVELAVIQPDLLRVPSILRHELFSNDIELVVRKEDATSNRRLGSLNFNLSLSLSHCHRVPRGKTLENHPENRRDVIAEGSLPIACAIDVWVCDKPASASVLSAAHEGLHWITAALFF